MYVASLNQKETMISSSNQGTLGSVPGILGYIHGTLGGIPGNTGLYTYIWYIRAIYMAH